MREDQASIQDGQYTGDASRRSLSQALQISMPGSFSFLFCSHMNVVLWQLFKNNSLCSKVKEMFCGITDFLMHVLRLLICLYCRRDNLHPTGHIWAVSSAACSHHFFSFPTSKMTGELHRSFKALRKLKGRLLHYLGIRHRLDTETGTLHPSPIMRRFCTLSSVHRQSAMWIYCRCRHTSYIMPWSPVKIVVITLHTQQSWLRFWPAWHSACCSHSSFSLWDDTIERQAP